MTRPQVARTGLVRARRVFTTRAGGVSTGRFARFNLGADVGDTAAAVAANRARAGKELGVPVVFLSPTGDGGVTVLPGGPDTDLRADALVVARVGFALAVPAADAVPVLLADPRAGVVAVAHVGRRSARAGVLPATVEAMTGLGARADGIEVLLGPALCGACHEVSAAERAAVDAILPGSAARARSGRPGLDLRAGLHRQVQALGIARVGADPRCTAETRDLYSEHRDGVTGRHAGITWLAAA